MAISDIVGKDLSLDNFAFELFINGFLEELTCAQRAIQKVRLRNRAAHARLYSRWLSLMDVTAGYGNGKVCQEMFLKYYYEWSSEFVLLSEGQHEWFLGINMTLLKNRENELLNYRAHTWERIKDGAFSSVTCDQEVRASWLVFSAAVGILQKAASSSYLTTKKAADLIFWTNELLHDLGNHGFSVNGVYMQKIYGSYFTKIMALSHALPPSAYRSAILTAAEDLPEHFLF